MRSSFAANTAMAFALASVGTDRARAGNAATDNSQDPTAMQLLVPPAHTAAQVRAHFHDPARGQNLLHVRGAERVFTDASQQQFRDLVISGFPANVRICLLVENPLAAKAIPQAVRLYTQDLKGKWQQKPALIAAMDQGDKVLATETRLLNAGPVNIRVSTDLKLTGIRILAIPTVQLQTVPPQAGSTATSSSGSVGGINLAPGTQANGVHLEGSVSGSTASGSGANVGGILAK